MTTIKMSKEDKARNVLEAIEQSEEGDMGRAFMEYTEGKYTTEELAEHYDNETVEELINKANFSFVGMGDDIEELLTSEAVNPKHDYILHYIDWKKMENDLFVNYDVYWFVK